MLSEIDWVFPELFFSCLLLVFLGIFIHWWILLFNSLARVDCLKSGIIESFDSRRICYELLKKISRGITYILQLGASTTHPMFDVCNAIWMFKEKKKNLLVMFLFYCLYNFIIFTFIFRITLRRTCYGTTVFMMFLCLLTMEGNEGAASGTWDVCLMCHTNVDDCMCEPLCSVIGFGKCGRSSHLQVRSSLSEILQLVFHLSLAIVACNLEWKPLI